MRSAKVTIAIPTFNRAELLRVSIDAALKQTYHDIEVLVTDNQSTDHTLDVLQSFSDSRLRWTRNESNLGMFGNWNRALELATGEYFLLLSDDDLISETFITEMLALFEKYHKLAFAYAQNDFIDQDGQEIHRGHGAPEIEAGWDVVKGFLASKRTLNPCNILFRTADLRALGGYAGERYHLAADAWAWMTLALKVGKVGFSGRTRAFYRLHTTNETTQVRISTWFHDHDTLLQDLLPLVPGRAKQLIAGIEQHKAIMLLELLGKQHQQGRKGVFLDAWKYRNMIFKHPSQFLLRKFVQLLLPPRLIQQVKAKLRKQT